MENQVLNIIKSRSSIRAFKSEKLSGEQVKALTGAALAAPSAMNRMPYKFIVIQDQQVLKELETAVIERFEELNETMMLERIRSRNNKVLYNAPCVIVIAVESESHYPLVDSGIAVQTMALAAKSMGLDSVIIGMISNVFSGSEAEEWKKRLSFPDGYHYGIGIAVGMADMEKAPHDPDSSKLVFIG